MGTTGPTLNANVNITITEMLKALGSQAPDAVKGYSKTLVAEFDRMNAAMKKQEEEIDRLKAKLDQLGETHHKNTGEMVSDMVKAENAWLLFDRTFRLGIDREMMTVLNAFPALKNFLAVLGGTPATLGILLAFQGVRMAIDGVIEGFHEYENALNATRVISDAWSDANEQVVDSFDKINVQIDEATERLDHLRGGSVVGDELRTRLDKARVAADELVSALKRDNDELDKTIKKSEEAGTGMLMAALIGKEPWTFFGSKLDDIHTKLDTIRRNFQEHEEEAKKLGSVTAIQAREQENLTATIASYNGVLTDVANLLEEAKKKQKEYEDASPWKRMLFDLRDYSQQLRALEGVQKVVTDQVQDLGAQNALQVAQDKLDAASKAQEALNKSQSQQKAIIDANKSVALEEVKVAEEAAREKAAAGLISQQELTSQLETFTAQRWAINKKAIEDELALAKANVAKRNEIPRLEASVKTGGMEAMLEADRLASESSRKQKEIADTDALRQIDTAKRVADSIVSTEVNNSKFLLSIHAITNDQDIANQKAAEQEKLDNFILAGQNKMAIWMTQADKGKEAAKVWGEQLTEIEAQTEDKLGEITNTGEQKRFEIREAAANAQISLEEARANRALEAAQRKATAPGSEGSTKASIKAQETALETWYAKETSLVDQQMEHLRALHQEDTAEYTNLINKKEQLDAEYAQKKYALDQQMSSQWRALQQQWIGDFNSTVDKWLTGQGRMSNNFRDMADQMGLQLSNMLLKMAEDQLKHIAMTVAAHIAGNTAKNASDAESAAVSATLTKESSLKEISAKAASAAAGAWNALSNIPVIGPVLGAAAAAATYAGIMALAAFKEGGIVGQYNLSYSQEVPILATPGERVLSVDQTNKFEKLVNRSSSTEGSGVHFHYSPNIQGIDGASVEKMAHNHGRVFERNAYHMMRVKGLVQ